MTAFTSALIELSIPIDTNLKNTFIAFLRERRLFSQWEDRMISYSLCGSYRTANDFLIDTRPLIWISGAFTYPDPKWVQINQSWVRYLISTYAK